MIYASQCDSLFGYKRGNHQILLVQVALNFEARLYRLPKFQDVCNSPERRVKIRCCDSHGMLCPCGCPPSFYSYMLEIAVQLISQPYPLCPQDNEKLA
jgi:hypothetical protein